MRDVNNGWRALLRRDAAAAEPEAGGDRPDMRTRFQPGMSGNPKGRPKGARGRQQIVAEIAGETHTIIEDEKPRRRTTLDLVLLSLRKGAVEGDVKAFRALHELLRRYDPQLPKKRSGFLIVPEPIDPDELMKEIEEYQREGRGE